MPSRMHAQRFMCRRPKSCQFNVVDLFVHDFVFNVIGMRRLDNADIEALTCYLNTQQGCRLIQQLLDDSPIVAVALVHEAVAPQAVQIATGSWGAVSYPWRCVRQLCGPEAY